MPPKRKEAAGDGGGGGGGGVKAAATAAIAVASKRKRAAPKGKKDDSAEETEKGKKPKGEVGSSADPASTASAAVGVIPKKNKQGQLVFPDHPNWFEGLSVKKQVSSPTYFNSVNKYGVHCGGDLHMWESSGWIKECDPYGWFQVFGPTGRWRTQLCNRVLLKGTGADDLAVSPKIRQLMQHWGYKLTEADLQAHAAKKAKKG
eukprot:jgi/Undpi1/6396/HiC_scaffold_20.g08877.m1